MLKIPFLTAPIYSLSLFVTTMFRNSIRDGMKILLSMTKIPSDDILESLYILRTRESDQLKTVLELYDRHGDSSEDIDAQLSKVEDDGEEKHRSENSTARF